MELAAGLGAAPPGGLILAAISAVFTIGYVADMLGEDEDWLDELSIDLFPEACPGEGRGRLPPSVKMAWSPSPETASNA